MRDPLGAAVLFRTMRKAIGVDLTIKIRGGWDDRTVNAVEIAASRRARRRRDHGAPAHAGRSNTAAGHRGRSSRAVVDAVTIPVIGNGDGEGLADARAMVDGHLRGCHDRARRPRRAVDLPGGRDTAR